MFAFQQKNLQDFKYALENMKADPNVLDKTNEMSIFQSILQTPNSGAFIKLCIEHDAEAYIVRKYHSFPQTHTHTILTKHFNSRKIQLPTNTHCITSLNPNVQKI